MISSVLLVFVDAAIAVVAVVLGFVAIHRVTRNCAGCGSLDTEGKTLGKTLRRFGEVDAGWIQQI